MLHINELFESSVNSDRSQTNVEEQTARARFESSVNSDRSQTILRHKNNAGTFESSVNSDRSQTSSNSFQYTSSLRVV